VVILPFFQRKHKQPLIDAAVQEKCGNVTMQRYLASGFGYKYFSSPFLASKVSEFANDLDLTSSFPSFYKYDENRDATGWVTYTDPTGLLIPLQGYACKLWFFFICQNS